MTRLELKCQLYVEMPWMAYREPSVTGILDDVESRFSKRPSTLVGFLLLNASIPYSADIYHHLLKQYPS
jgi:hypothetical protein